MSLSEMGFKLLYWFKKNEFNVSAILVFSEKSSSPSIKRCIPSLSPLSFESSLMRCHNLRG